MRAPGPAIYRSPVLNWSEYRLFFRQFRERFHDTGAVLPSGRFLSRQLARAVAAERSANNAAAGGRRILEVGPGTGAVTNYILPHLLPGDQLDLVEINEQFVELLKRRFADEPAWTRVRDQVRVRQVGIEHVSEPHGFDIIVSSLPLNNFQASFVREILERYVTLARPQARVTFFEYIAVRTMRQAWATTQEKVRLREIGAAIRHFTSRGTSRRHAVWANIPPAWVHDVRLGS